MEQLEGQPLVDLAGIIPTPTEMMSHHDFDPLTFEVRPRERSRIEQHLSNVIGEGAPVPDSKVKGLVPTKEEAFEAERR